MWCAKLSDSQRDAMRALIKAQPEAGPALVAALEALDLARWDDLPEATLPWERVSELASRSRGVGEADVVWDLTARHPSRLTSRTRQTPRPPCGRAFLGVSSRRRGGTSHADRSADGDRGVEADEVEERERAHRVAGAERHAGVDRLWVEAVSLEQANGVEEVGEKQPVDDEAGGCRGPRRPSFRARAERVNRARVDSGEASGKDSSTSSIL